MKTINFMGKRKLWFSISLTIILIGLISLLTQGLNLGIDFTGGTLFHLQFEQPVTVSQIQDVLGDHGLTQAVPKLSEGNVVIVRTETIPDEKRDDIIDDFASAIGPFEEMGGRSVAPFIGRELQQQALLGLLIAAIAMIIYITIRFEFKFAMAAIAAILHDVLIVLGVFSLLRLEVDVAFVAAVLTVVGYSINDTIVIFDRIRENVALHPRMKHAEVANKSINDTISRSINTSLTTLFMVVALLIFGGPTIRDFVFALFVGVLSGTFSSIFIASPIWVAWKEKKVAAKQA